MFWETVGNADAQRSSVHDVPTNGGMYVYTVL